MTTNTAAAASRRPALERLTADQRARLDSLCASFAMENMDLNDDAREVGARFLLNEVTFDQALAELRRLDA